LLLKFPKPSPAYRAYVHALNVKNCKVFLIGIILICILISIDNTDAVDSLYSNFDVTYLSTSLYCGILFGIALIGIVLSKSNALLQKAFVWFSVSTVFIFLFLIGYLDVIKGIGLMAPALGYMIIAVMFSTRFLIMVPAIIGNGLFFAYYALFVAQIEIYDITSFRVGLFSVVMFSIMVFVFVERQRRAVFSAREALAAKVDQLNRALDVKSTFLGHMSHELRTPLNAIIGFSDILLMGNKPAKESERLDEYLGHINSGGRHLLGLVNDVLDQSKLEAGEVSVNSERFEIRNELQNHLDDLSSLFTLKEQSSLLKVPKKPVFIETDPRLLKQIMINLLSNAQKFTPAYGKVEVTVSKAPNKPIIIVISDTGSGMAEDVVAYLNDSSSVSKTHYVREAEGTGLGLIIVRQIVQLLGGEVYISSTLGEGTDVTVTMPAKYKK